MTFDGRTYSAPRDRARLIAQFEKVKALMLDGKWHTLAELSGLTGAPQASVSARIRDLRKSRFGGYKVRRQFVVRGLFEYQLVA